jgi:dTDP-4-amino-4,6-dideoxygalactose transaminase
MCNGTIALEIAIRALKLKGEVFVPSFYLYRNSTQSAMAGNNAGILRF